MSDFYEDDEQIEELTAAFEAGEKGLTGPTSTTDSERAEFESLPESEKIPWLKARDQRIGDLPDADVELCRGGTSANGVFPYLHVAPWGGTCRCGAIATGNAKPTSIVRSRWAS